MKLKTLTQTYNDGVVKIYTSGNTAEEGNMPKEGLTLKVGPLRYEERIVGMNRYWSGKQFKNEVTRLVRVPLIVGVITDDVAVLDDDQYKILQVQYIKEVDPSSMDLSLEKLEAKYEIN